MQFVIIGHITRDVTDQGHILGGTAAYAGIMAQQLGVDVILLTRAASEDVRHPALSGIEIINLPSTHTTTFQNSYHNGHRTQHVRVVARPIMVDDVPERLYGADAMLLAPLVQEVDPAIPPRVRGALAATPQGWLREWDERGQIRAVPWYSAGRILPHLDTLVFSNTDLIGDLSILPAILQTVPTVVITQDEMGCVLFREGKQYKIPARPATVVDPTGAGDVFVAAFQIRLLEGAEPQDAAYFANVAASMSVEAAATAGIPQRDQIEAYIHSHPLPLL